MEERKQNVPALIFNVGKFLTRWKFFRFFILTASIIMIIFGVFYTVNDDHVHRLIYLKEKINRQQMDLKLHTKLLHAEKRDIFSFNQSRSDPINIGRNSKSGLSANNKKVHRYDKKITLTGYLENNTIPNKETLQTTVPTRSFKNHEIKMPGVFSTRSQFELLNKENLTVLNSSIEPTQYDNKGVLDSDENGVQELQFPGTTEKYNLTDRDLAVPDYFGASEPNLTRKKTKTKNGFIVTNDTFDNEANVKISWPTTTIETSQTTKIENSDTTLSTILITANSTSPKTPLTHEEFEKLLTEKRSNEKKCHPVKNVVFLKTHKTGSSTVINIMQRFGHNNQLKIALPGVNHFLGWPNLFQSRYVFEYTGNETYDILCNHARFHKKNIQNIMSSPETKYVTIVRDPLYQFESTAVYLNFASLFKLNRSKGVLESFFEDRSKKDIIKRCNHRNTHNVFLVKNPIAFDLGVSSWEQTDTDVTAFLDTVKRDFDLVMISDYMAESLIMLKNLLCWDMKDVLHFTMNRRAKKYRPNIKNPIKLRSKVKSWNRLDYSLFDEVNKTFWEKIEKGGKNFKTEVEMLKNMNLKLSEICLQRGSHRDKSQPWFPIEGYKLNDQVRHKKYFKLCEDMIRSEIDYTNMLKLHATRYNWTVPTSRPLIRKRIKP